MRFDEFGDAAARRPRYRSFVTRPPDPIFGDPRLASIYDDVDSDRSDLDHYVDIVREKGAQRVLDVGCGTGSLACRLALAGYDVIGVDPAEASLDVARAKRGADGVRWIHGDSTSLPSDLAPSGLAVMTGNVAQVFVSDEEWTAALRGIESALTGGGHVVFETRDPAQRGWEAWDTGGATTVIETRHGDVETWTTVLEVAEPLVTFRHHYRFIETGDVLESDSTLRFRTLAELNNSLGDAGFAVEEVRDAPDRPGLEFVVIARKPSARAADA